MAETEATELSNSVVAKTLEFVENPRAMAKRYDIYGMGNALVDIVTEVDDAFFASHGIEKGVMTLVDEARQRSLVDAIDLQAASRQCGGSAANTVIGAAQFGASTFYSCKVANDEMGEFYRADLRANQVDTNLEGKELPPGITGKCLVMTTQDAERTMNTYLGITATYSSDDIAPEALSSSRYLYIEGYLVTGEKSRQAMKDAKALAEAQGVKVALTFSDPAMVKYFGAEMGQVLGEGVDLLFCNEEEALLFTETASVEAASAALKALAKQFVITRGPKGALIWDGEGLLPIEAAPARAIDTNGAGDMFAGAFLYGLTRDFTPARAATLASLASSRVVSKFGPRLDAQQARELLSQV